MNSTWNEEYKKKQEKLRKLALLCLEARELTDDELQQIVENNNELFSYLYGRASFASSGATRLLQARNRRLELEKLSTEGLKKRLGDIRADHARAIADDVDDTADDSLYEAPSSDSDEVLIGNILESREEGNSR